jgi:hypothetical protein
MMNKQTVLYRDRLFMPILVLICLIAAGFLALSAASILRNRAQHLNESIIKSRTQAQVLGETISGMLYTVDYALLTAAAMIKNQDDSIDDGFSPETSAFIKEEITFLPRIRDIVFTHAQKNREWRILGTDMPFTLTSFEEFRSAWLESAVEPVFSDDTHALILLSRRVETQQNRFAGVLTAIMDTSFFFNGYDDYLHLDADGIALFDAQGRFLAGDRGVHQDDDTRMVSTYQLRNFPFHVAFMHDKKDLLKKWRQETRRDIALISATFLTALFTLALALRQRKLRRNAEHRLMKHQQGLEETIRRRTAQLRAANTGLKEKNQDLEAAMKEIKTLSGLLPICMHCKKIRNDRGYWQQMETYIHEHSDAQFSHSICRECADKFYPDMDLYEDEEN